jgi:molecular chaperone DnaK
VTARDRATSKENRVTITGATTLSKEEVDRMVREAEQNAAEDLRRAEQVEIRNQADSIAYQAERALQEAGERVPMDLRGEIESKVRAVREAVTNNDVAAMRRTTADLQTSMQRIGEAVYSATGGRSGGNGSGGDGAQGSSTADDVVDAEFKEV